MSAGFAVTPEVPIGFVVLQVRFTEQELLPVAMVQDVAEGVKLPYKNLAVTVQSPVILPVV